MSHNSFRPLNSNEIHMLGTSAILCTPWNEKTESYSIFPRYALKHMSTEDYYLENIRPDWLEVSYETIFSDHRTNPTPEFVICLIRCYIVEAPIAFVWRGVSRCAKGDIFNRQRGEALAFLRAIRHSKPVEI